VSHPLRARIETGLALLCGVLTVLTLVWSEWIEALFHVEPDGGSGATEWVIVAVLALVTLALAAAARADRRRAATETH
jgi:MYXO-CTERM domain-containing protein